MSKRRPNLGKAIKEVMRDVSRRMPEFGHIDPSRILVVAGEARRASRATVRPLAFSDSRDRISADRKRAKPLVQIRGRQMLYVVAFRPMFFLRSTAEQRVETILHELWHISPRFDGTLDRARRHTHLSAEGFRAHFDPLVERYLGSMPDALREALGHRGEALVRHWLERPAPFFRIDSKGRSKDPGKRVIFTEAQLFYGPVKMLTSPSRPARRPASARLPSSAALLPASR